MREKHLAMVQPKSVYVSQTKKRSEKSLRPFVKIFYFVTILCLYCYSSYAQTVAPVAPTGIEEIYLAKDDGEGKAGEQVTEFRTNDIPIYCVVLLESGEATVVKMNFVAVSVAGVRPETKVVTASYTTKQGQNRVNFSGRPDGKWTPGKYRVDMFLDGKKVKDLEFEIKDNSSKTVAAKTFQPTDASKPKPGKRPDRTQP